MAFSSSSSSSSVRQESGRRCRQFSLSEIKDATNNFDDALMIETSHDGKTYKGVITDDRQGGSSTTFAVKRYDPDIDIREEFLQKLSLFSEINNDYLLSLLGVCDESGEMIIMYEYMSNGNLAKHLYSEQLRSCLSWEQCLEICVNVARGVEFLYLKSKTDGRGIIPRYLSPTNIYLDQNMVAKLDCVEFKIGEGRTDVRGELFYLDPYYNLTGQLTRTANIYSLGMILLEVLCRKLQLETEPFYKWHSWKTSDIKDLLEENIDTNLKKEISPDCFHRLLDIVVQCTQDNPRKRPLMGEVVKKLEDAIRSQLRHNYASGSTFSNSGNTVCEPVEEPSITPDPVVSATQEDNEKEKHVDNYSKEEQC